MKKKVDLFVIPYYGLCPEVTLIQGFLTTKICTSEDEAKAETDKINMIYNSNYCYEKHTVEIDM